MAGLQWWACSGGPAMAGLQWRACSGGPAVAGLLALGSTALTTKSHSRAHRLCAQARLEKLVRPQDAEVARGQLPIWARD